MLVFDRGGDVYYAGLVFNISSTGVPGNTVAFVAKYVNDGSTYSGVTLITGPLFADKEWIAVDTTGGPNDGNLYMAFDANLTATSYFGTLFTRSTDGGKTFSAPFYAPADETGELPGVTVDASGNVYVSSDAFNPITEVNLNYIQVSKITGGGTVLAQTVRAVNPASWLTGPPPGASFRAFTIPQLASDARGVYLAFDDVRLGNVNVFLTRSTDGGTTWSTPLRVNDGLTGHNIFMGDYIQIAAAPLAAHPIWSDNRFACDTMDPIYGCVDQDAFTATIGLSGPVGGNRLPTNFTALLTPYSGPAIFHVLGVAGIILLARRVGRDRPSSKPEIYSLDT